MIEKSQKKRRKGGINMKKILAFLLAAAIILPSLSVPVSAGEVSPEYPIIDYPLNQAGTVVANWDQATQKLTFSPRNGGGIIEREFLYSKENLDDNTPKGLFERIRKNSGAGYDSPPYLDGLGSLYDIQNVTFTFEKDAGLPVDSSYLFSNFKGLITFSPDYDVSHVTNMEGLFQNGYRSVEGTANWDTGNVTNMKKTFYNNYGNSDVSNWDTGKVTTMESMFEWAIYCNPDVSNWDTSQVTTMEKMFYNARSANPNVTNWNTGRVTNMKEMFYNTWTADPDVSNWDTSQVITMESMFSGAGKANPNVRNWNTGQVQNMYCMFFRAPSAQPDVSNWDVSQVQNMGYMFYQMNSLKKVDLRKWQFASNVYTHYMFGLLPALDYIYLPAVHPDIFSGGCFSGDFLQHIDGQEPGPVIYGSSNYYLFKATGSPTLYYMEGSMYPLTVNSGKAMINNYVVTGGFPGNEVTIFANYAPDGQHFKEWQIIKGAVTLTDATAAITSFIMPAEEVEITATYEGNPLIPLGTPTDLAWDADRPGMATWGFVPNAGSYNIKLLKDGEGILNQANFPSVEYDFMAIIEENGAGDYTFMVQAVGDQVAYVDGPWSVLSPVYHYAPTPPTYEIVVNSGNAEPSSAQEGELITITADDAADGQQFKEWQIIKGTITLADATAATTSFTMPAEDVEITATYEDIPVVEYAIIMHQAKALVGGNEVTAAAEGSDVTIVANAAPDGQQFKEWQIIQGAVTLSNATAAAASFIMPAEEVEISATYEDTPLIVLGTPTDLAWDSSTPGMGSWTFVENANSYNIKLFKDGEEIMNETNFPSVEYDFMTIIIENGAGDYTFMVQAFGDGEIYADGPWSELSPVYHYAPVPPTYEINVNHGSAKPSEAPAGENITITADAPPTNQHFKEWIINQGTITLANTNEATTTFIMPAENVEVTATYEQNEPTSLAAPTDLAWDSSIPGRGSWTFVDNANGYNIQLLKDDEEIMNETNFPSVEYDFMAIIAENGAGDYTFIVQAIGDGVIYDDSPWSEPSPVYHYAPAPPTYEINVNYGSAEPSEAPAGETITITADAPPANQHFKEWIINQGTVTLANANEATTTFIMPAENVEVTATYEQNEPTQLAAPTGLAWDTTIPGKAIWTAVPNAIGYHIALFKDGQKITDDSNHPSTEYDFTEY
ncbi:BspA family leucine-rich repeat surface protein, partial [Clostridiales bacterium COT073_COT-073]